MEDIFLVKDKRKDSEKVIVLEETDDAARAEELSFTLNTMQNDMNHIENNIETINKIQAKNIEKLKNIKRDMEKMKLILDFNKKKNSDVAKPRFSNTQKSSTDYRNFLSTPSTSSGYFSLKRDTFKTGHDDSPRKKMRGEIIEEADNSKAENVMEDMMVKSAIQKSKGILSPQELKMFLDLVKLVSDPVQLAKVSFTNEVKQLYFQLVTLKDHIQTAFREHCAPFESTLLKTVEETIEKFRESQ